MRILVRIAVVLSGLLAGAAATSVAAADPPPSVVASVKPLHSLVAGVMQGVGQPKLLLAAGQSPHTYTLKPSDARALETADLVVWVGPSLETFLQQPVEAIARPEASFRTIDVAGLELLPTRKGGAWDAHDHENEHGHDDEHAHEAAQGHDADAGTDDIRDRPGRQLDPHVWLDPDNARVLVSAIAARLSAIDPANADSYASNAEATRTRIAEAAADAGAVVAPVRGQAYIVFHDAYHYFEHHYGLHPAGSITLSPDRKPGARRLIQIRDKIAELGARCVFREPQFAPDLVQTVVDGTGASVGTLDPLGADLPAGPDAYPQLLRSLARDFSDCLTRAH